MTIDYQKLLNWDIPQVEQQLTRRDTIIYALGVGLGADPMDANELQFVYEENLKALPTMAIGFNQAIMFAFFMVIIAAFIGTQDLGQELQRTLAGTNLF